MRTWLNSIKVEIYINKKMKYLNVHKLNIDKEISNRKLIEKIWIGDS